MVTEITISSVPTTRYQPAHPRTSPRKMRSRDGESDFRGAIPAYARLHRDPRRLRPDAGRRCSVRGVPLSEAPTFSSKAEELDGALKAILARLAKANLRDFPAYTVARYGLQKQLEAFLGATGIPFATTAMSKAVLSELHPLYLGLYNGEFSRGDVRKNVEGADLVLDIGAAVYCDADTGAFSAHIDFSNVVTIWPDHVEIGSAAETAAAEKRPTRPST